MASFLHRYEVGKVPWFFLPLYWIYGGLFGFLFYSYFWFCRKTCRIELEGLTPEKLQKNYILSTWHENGNIFFLLNLRRDPFVMMSHPFWYMYPYIIFARLLKKEKVVLGSAGNHGREAADQLVQYLKEGYSTAIVPDGPEGPPYVLKRGILHIAMQSGVSIIPLRFISKRCLRMPKWDRMFLPIPFISRIKVAVGPRVVVSEATMVAAGEEITIWMGRSH